MGIREAELTGDATTLADLQVGGQTSQREPEPSPATEQSQYR